MIRIIFTAFFLLFAFGLFIEYSIEQDEKEALEDVKQTKSVQEFGGTSLAADQIAFNKVIEQFITDDRDLIAEIEAIKDKSIREIRWKEVIKKRGLRWESAKPMGLVSGYRGVVDRVSTSTVVGGKNSGKTRLDISIKGHGAGAKYESDACASILLEDVAVPGHWMTLKSGDEVTFSGNIFVKIGDPAYFCYWPKISSFWPTFSFVFSDIQIIRGSQF